MCLREYYDSLRMVCGRLCVSLCFSLSYGWLCVSLCFFLSYGLLCVSPCPMVACVFLYVSPCPMVGCVFLCVSLCFSVFLCVSPCPMVGCVFLHVSPCPAVRCVYLCFSLSRSRLPMWPQSDPLIVLNGHSFDCGKCVCYHGNVLVWLTSGMGLTVCCILWIPIHYKVLYDISLIWFCSVLIDSLCQRTSFCSLLYVCIMIVCGNIQQAFQLKIKKRDILWKKNVFEDRTTPAAL